jgi:polysaccharide pyruvyl transferase WcaK-like protein
MQTITLLDTGLASDNLGDEIIMEAAESVIFDLFPNAYYYRIASHELMSYRARTFVERSDLCFIGGTNLLASRMGKRSQWPVRWRDARWMDRAICLGVGWNDYSRGADLQSRLLLRALLAKDVVHSVRDSYTERRASEAGIVCVNTACPTMWSLTPAHCTALPRRKAAEVVFTLTAWRADPAADRTFVEMLKRHYRRVHFFCQMREDWDYLQGFGIGDLRTIRPTTRGYSDFLARADVDYVGTRLHGGVRALQMGKRSLILGVDNRSIEIQRDTDLPVLPRHDIPAVESWIEGEQRIALRLPWAEIDSWKSQFRRQTAASATEGAAA